MRLLFLTLIICVSSSAGAFAPSLQPGLRLPELPEYKPRAFYYWQVMTAHEHGRVVTTEDGAPLKIHLAVKVLAGEDEAIIVIRRTVHRSRYIWPSRFWQAKTRPSSSSETQPITTTVNV